jgi:3-oxoacyl-[acyl-carrier protein] reductase
MTVDTGLAGKVALITGVSRRNGIGAAVALELARQGAAIVTTYFRPFDRATAWGGADDEPELVLGEVRACGVRAAGIELDLADVDSPRRLFDFAETNIGPVDVLINNAAYSSNGDIYALTASALDARYAVNMRGTALLCREFLSRHDGRPGGRIINLTSGQGVAPMPDEIAYVMTKGAIEALTVSLSPTAARKGITVNAVDPGATDTGWIDDKLRAQLVAHSPFGRIGLPADAAATILFLASAQAAWITGQVVHARGGL